MQDSIINLINNILTLEDEIVIKFGEKIDNVFKVIDDLKDDIKEDRHNFREEVLKAIARHEDRIDSDLEKNEKDINSALRSLNSRVNKLARWFVGMIISLVMAITPIVVNLYSGMHTYKDQVFKEIREISENVVGIKKDIEYMKQQNNYHE